MPELALQFALHSTNHDLLSTSPDHLTVGEVRDNMGHFGGFRYSLFSVWEGSWKGTVTVRLTDELGEAIDVENKNWKIGDLIELKTEDWINMPLVRTWPESILKPQPIAKTSKLVLALLQRL